MDFDFDFDPDVDSYAFQRLQKAALQKSHSKNWETAQEEWQSIDQVFFDVNTCAEHRMWVKLLEIANAKREEERIQALFTRRLPQVRIRCMQKLRETHMLVGKEI